MSDKKNLLEKKQELETELDHIQKALDLSLNNVRNDVEDKVNPMNFIRRHPLPVVGAAVLTGLILGYDRKRSGDEDDDEAPFLSGMLTGALALELKKLVTRKAVRYASGYLEDLIDNSSLAKKASRE